MKIKSFKDIARIQNESPVGKVGRTKDSEALEHIENSDVARRFRKIVRELGGKSVARQLLSGMTPSGNSVSIPTAKENIDEGESKSIETFLREMGYKIKDEKAGIRTKELIFFKSDDAKEAFKDLEDFNYINKFNISLDTKNKKIGYNI